MSKNNKLEDQKLLMYKDVQEILEAGEFDKFIGCGETLEFEAKPLLAFTANTYQTKLELSKKIAGFCNSDSRKGFLVLGLENLNNANTSFKDTVTAISAVPLSETHENRPKKLISNIFSLVYPKPQGVEIKWYPSAQDQNTGLWAICVPEQELERLYFMVRVHESNGEKVEGDYYGIPIRRGDGTAWLSASDMYIMSRRKILTEELMHQNVLKAMAEVKELIVDLKPRQQVNTKKLSRINSKIKEILNEQ